MFVIKVVTKMLKVANFPEITVMKLYIVNVIWNLLNPNNFFVKS